MQKHDINPMQSAHAAPRCCARSKRSGNPCRAPAVRGWRVCRMHGAGGGHRPGRSHPSWKHGMRAREWLDERERERAQLGDQIEALREHAERQSADHRQALAVLTDQREKAI
jgi:hypothetical protein